MNLLDLLDQAGIVDPPSAAGLGQARSGLIAEVRTAAPPSTAGRFDQAATGAGDRTPAEPGPRRRHPRRWPAKVTVAAVVAAVTIGGGIAAATGLLTPEDIANDLAGASPSNPTENPAHLHGAVLRDSLPGPGSTTFQLSTASAAANNTHHVGECVNLALLDSSGRIDPTFHTVSACGLLAGPPDAAPLPRSDLHDGNWAGVGSVDAWTAPTGVRYTILYGDAGDAVTTVALTNAHGVPATVETTRQGWYILYVPHPAFLSSHYLSEYDRSGRMTSKTSWGDPFDTGDLETTSP